MPNHLRAPRLSAGELELLHVLWKSKGGTLLETQLGLGRRIGYTTVQTRLNRLVAKGLATRSDDRPAVYRANVAPATVSARDLDTLIDRVSGGKVVPLVAHLVQDRSLTREEVTELKRLIVDAERRLGKRGTRP